MIDPPAVLAYLDRVFRFSSLLGTPANAILTYHSVGEPDKFGNVSEPRFESDLQFLTRSYDVVDLPEVVPASDPAEEKKVAITFDDGYANFYSTAFPYLQKYETPATVFVSPGFIGDRNRDLLDRRHRGENPTSPVMMTRSHLVEVANSDLVTVGNHTDTHERVSAIDDEAELQKEILDAKATLEAWLDTSIDRFSYPYGAFDERSVGLVSDSHDVAVTIRSGLIRGDVDQYLLPRIAAHRSPDIVRWEVRTGIGVSHH